MPTGMSEIALWRKIQPNITPLTAVLPGRRKLGDHPGREELPGYQALFRDVQVVADDEDEQYCAKHFYTFVEF